jgi:hypothetical protein
MTDVKNAVDDLLTGIVAGAIPAAVFCDDAVLDATVPNWRFSVRGGDSVRTELGRWYADPGHFEELRRIPLPDGELVEFALTWEEQGIPHACHQAHLLRLRDGRIASDTAFCGGRWPAPLIAEMEAAATAAS